MKRRTESTTLRKRLARAYERLFLIPAGKANYTGSIFDRIEGLELLLARATGSSVLDVGACDGMVSYEFARSGATLVHGLELDAERVWVANRVFRDVPVESRFDAVDLARGVQHLERATGGGLLGQYDIVLYLGIHHHLRKQMNDDELAILAQFLLKKARTYFAVRTPRIESIAPLILGSGFRLISESKKQIGHVQVYERG